MTVSKPSSPLPTKITLAVLFCAMIALFSVMILSSGTASPSATPLDPALLTLPRAAQGGVNFLHGEGDEQAVDCFKVAGVHYVVGTTTSRTCDFTSTLQGKNAFIALMQGGSVTRVKVFGTDGNDELVAARLGQNELLALGQSDRDPSCVVVYRVRYSDLAVTEQVLRTDEPVYPLALYADGGEAVCLAQAVDGTRIHAFTLTDGHVQESVLDDPRGRLAFCEVFPSANGYDLLATLVAGKEAYPVVFSFGAVTAKTEFSALAPASLVDVIPAENGYAMLLQGEGEMRLELAQGKTRTTLARLAYTGRAEIFPHGEDGLFLAFYDHDTYAIVRGGVTTVALPASKLLAVTVGADGTAQFALAYEDGVGLYSTQGRLCAVEHLDQTIEPARSLLAGADKNALFSNDGVLLFSAPTPAYGTEITLLLFT